MKGTTRTFVIALAMATILATVATGAAVAGKGPQSGGQAKGHHDSSTATGSFSLVLLNSTDGQAHWGQQVTFNVTSNAQYYFVSLMCYQSGAWVYGNTIGFYPGWPWSKIYYLQSGAWTGGAADCNAELYSSYSDGSNRQTLATTGFHVAA